jgi:hypothetical protein
MSAINAGMDVMNCNGTPCVPASQLYGKGGLMSRYMYDHHVKRQQLRVVVRGGNGRMAMVDYNSIPDRLRIPYEARHGDPTMPTAVQYFESNIAYDPAAVRFFAEYTFEGKRLSEEVLKEYVANAAVLSALGKTLDAERAANRAANARFIRRAFWERYAATIQHIRRETYPHTLGANPRRLEKRYNRYLAEGYASILHAGRGNRNAAKVADETQESVMFKLLADPRNLDNEMVAALYNRIAAQRGWETITAATVAVRRKANDLYTYAGRRGSAEFRNRKTMQHKRSAPTRPLDYWTLDGWDVELLYKVTPEKGAATYHHRPAIVLVLDPAANYPIGYAIGTHETPALIKEALRNAVNHVRELFGGRFIVGQLQSDHYGRGVMTPLYEALSAHYTPARVKNAKAKVIEPFFNRINAKCHLLPNWSGFGATAGKDLQPNVEWLNAHRRQFTDWDGVCAQITRIMAELRAETIAEYRALWEAADHGDLKPISDELYLYLFGAETGFKNKLNPDGIRITIGDSLYNYDCFDRRMREHMHIRWTVKYDPDDLSRALACNDDGTLQFMLEQKYVQPMALADRKEGDGGQLARVNQFNRDLEAEIIARHQRASDVIEANLDPTLSKLLLCDSDGQHKDRRNAARTTDIAALDAANAGNTDNDDDFEYLFDARQYLNQI